jgi:hypothetical protein
VRAEAAGGGWFDGGAVEVGPAVLGGGAAGGNRQAMTREACSRARRRAWVLVPSWLGVGCASWCSGCLGGCRGRGRCGAGGVGSPCGRPGPVGMCGGWEAPGLGRWAGGCRGRVSTVGAGAGWPKGRGEDRMGTLLHWVWGSRRGARPCREGSLSGDCGWCSGRRPCEWQRCRCVPGPGSVRPGPRVSAVVVHLRRALRRLYMCGAACRSRFCVFVNI